MQATTHGPASSRSPKRVSFMCSRLVCSSLVVQVRLVISDRSPSPIVRPWLRSLVPNGMSAKNSLKLSSPQFAPYSEGESVSYAAEKLGRWRLQELRGQHRAADWGPPATSSGPP